MGGRGGPKVSAKWHYAAPEDPWGGRGGSSREGSLVHFWIRFLPMKPVGSVGHHPGARRVFRRLGGGVCLGGGGGLALANPCRLGDPKEGEREGYIARERQHRRRSVRSPSLRVRRCTVATPQENHGNPGSSEPAVTATAPSAPCTRRPLRHPNPSQRPSPTATPPLCVTFRLVVAPLRGPGRSPVLPFACCVGSLRSVGRCGRCSCWCRFRVRGAR